MQNIIYGIITMVICSFVYFLAWRYYKKEQYATSVLLIAFSGLLLFLFTASDFFLHVWDERYHALVAKNFLKHPLIPTLYDNPVLSYDYKMWVGNHIWLHKQPLPLWLMAISMKVFGINEIAVRLPSIVMSTIGVVLTIQVGSYFFNKKTGVLAAFLFSVNGLIIELTGGRVATDHVDISFLFFILLSIFLSIQFVKKRSVHYSILIGITIGGALLTKWLAGLIVLPVWLLLTWGSNSLSLKTIVINFALILLTTAMVAIPWQVYIHHQFPLEAMFESNFNLRHFTEVIEERSGSVFYFIHKIRLNYGELVYLPLLWLTWITFTEWKNFKHLALCTWIFIPLIIFSLAKTKMQAYLLFTAPAIFIISAAFFFKLRTFKKSHRFEWIFNIVLALFIILPLRYCIERVKPFEKRNRNPQWVADLKKLNEEKIQQGILFNYDRPIEAMFYTDLVAYPNLPAFDKIEQLKKEGYLVLINDKGDISHLENVEGVNVIKLSVAE